MDATYGYVRSLINLIVRASWFIFQLVCRKQRTVRGSTEIHRAALQNVDLPTILQRFRRYNRFDVNYVDKNDLTHFHVACKYGCYEIVEQFLKFGQNPNCATKNGISPLNLALTNSRPEVIELLLRNGADPNSADDKGRTPVHLLIESRRIDLLINYLRVADEIGRKVNVDDQDKSGETPLLLALRVLPDHSIRNVLSLLIQRGANPNGNDATASRLPLHALAEKYSFLTMKTFFALSDKMNKPVKIDSKGTHNKNSALHVAVNKGDKEMVKFLLKRGADCNSANGEGIRPLHLISQKLFDDGLARAFFDTCHEENQKVLINAKDHCLGYSPLHFAARCGNEKVLETLLENNAIVNCLSRKAEPSTHEVCGECSYFSSVSPLHLAAEVQSREGIILLLKHRANPNEVNGKRETVLHIICQTTNDDDLAETFFEACDQIRQTVDIDAEDDSGQTALQLAVANLLPKIVKLLLERGADLTKFVPPHKQLLEDQLRIINDYGKIRSISAYMFIIEQLEENLDIDLTPLTTSFLMKHGLHEISRVSHTNLLNNNQYFVRTAKGIIVKSNMTLYEIVNMRPEEEDRLLSYYDYYAFSYSTELGELMNDMMPHSIKEIFERHMCEKMSRTYLLKVAAGPMWDLFNKRLPMEVISLLLKKDLSNNDLIRIYLASK